MKRIQPLALLFALALLLSACSPGPAPAETTALRPEAPHTEASATVTPPETTAAPETERATEPADADGICWQAAFPPRPAADAADVLRALREDDCSARRAAFAASAEAETEEMPIGDGGLEAATAPELADGVRTGGAVQTDGAYLYLIDGFGLRIQTAAGAESRLLSYTPVQTGAEVGDAWLQTLFVTGDRAAVLYTRLDSEDGAYDATQTHAAIFDVSDRERPVQIADLGADGGLQTACLLPDDTLLLVTNRYVWDAGAMTEDRLPRLWTADGPMPIPPEDILLCDSPSTAAFTLLTTLSLTDGTILDALACDDAGMAVCPGETAVILARPVWSVGSADAGTDGVYALSDWTDRTQTELLRLARGADGALTPDVSARVEGGILSPDAARFDGSAVTLVTADARHGFRRYTDEAKGFQNDEPAQASLVNRLYVLDEAFGEVGRLEHLGQDEPICAIHLSRRFGWISTISEPETLQLLDLAASDGPTLGTALNCPGASRLLRVLDDGRLFCLSVGEAQDGVTLTRFDVSDPQDARTEATLSATGFAHTPALWYAPALYAEADGSRVGFPVSGMNQTAFRLYRWSKKAAEYREVGTTALEYLPEESETLRLGGELYVCSAGVTYALDAKTAALLATITDAVG